MNKFKKLFLAACLLFPLISLADNLQFLTQKDLFNKCLSKEINCATLYYPANGDTITVDLSDQAYIKELFSKGLKLLTNHKLGVNVPATGITWSLSQPITTVATTIPLTSVKDLTGTTITQGNLPTKVYLVIDPNSATNIENIVCPSSGYSSTNKQFTNCTRGLSLQGTSESSNPLFEHAHASGATVIMSNVGQFYSNFVDIDSNQTIAGVKTFSSSPSVPTPSGVNDATPKTYVDTQVVAGAPVMSTTTRGTAFISSAPASSTNPIVLNSEEVTTTAGISKVPRATSTGKLDSGWIDQTANYTLTGTINLNGTTTINGANFSSSSLSKFGGSGVDGVINGTSNITLSDASGSVIVKNYSSWAGATSTKTFTITNPSSIVILRIKGNADFTNWTFNLKGKGGLFGAGGASGAGTNTAGTAGTQGTDTVNLLNTFSIVYGGKGSIGSNGFAQSGAGGGGNEYSAGTNGSLVGGSTIGAGGAISTYPAKLVYVQSRKCLSVSMGAGGGGSAGATSSNSSGTSRAGGASSGAAGTDYTGTYDGGGGGAGGNGGGALIIEVGGNIIFNTTSIDVSGDAGGRGGNGGTANGFGGGGGGGGAGGNVLVLYNGSLTGSVTPTVSGGSGGAAGTGAGGNAGAAGGAGANGSYLIEKNITW